MILPEGLFNGNQIAYHILIPFNFHILESLSQNHYCQIPCIPSRYSHIVKALDQIMRRYFPIFPLICKICAGGFTFKSGILSHYQTVNICQHKRIFFAPVHLIGTAYSFTGSFHKPPCHIFLQIPSLPHGFTVR